MPARSATCLLLVAIAQSGCGQSDSNDGAPSPKTVGYTLDDVDFGGGVYVAVGDAPGRRGGDPLLVRSTDGRHWSRVDVGENGSLFGVTYGGGRFVAVGLSETSGTNLAPLILVSNDGLSFHRATDPGDFSAPVRDVAYGNGVYAAMESEGRISASSDGEVWKDVGEGSEAGHGESIAFGAGSFLATGDSGYLTSPDGMTWTFHSPPSGLNLSTVKFVNGEFLVRADDALPCDDACDGLPEPRFGWLRSADALHLPEAFSIPDQAFDDVAFADGTYVAAQMKPLLSADASTWTPAASPGDPESWYRVTAGDAGFVMVAWGAIGWSPEGKTWSVLPIPK